VTFLHYSLLLEQQTSHTSEMPDQGRGRYYYYTAKPPSTHLPMYSIYNTIQYSRVLFSCAVLILFVSYYSIVRTNSIPTNCTVQLLVLYALLTCYGTVTMET